MSHVRYGAKITGGGSGGTVAVLARADARGRLLEVADAYLRQSGRQAQVSNGSSPGAAAFGLRKACWTAGGWCELD
jgi:galactokinase